MRRNGRTLPRNPPVEGGASGAAVSEDLDQYGGWTGRQFESTGFFRVEKDERWWLVTPDDGNAVPQLRRQSSSPRLVATGLQPGRLERAPRRRPPGPDRIQNRAASLSSCKHCGDYGFNSVGVHNSLDLVNTPRPSMPYVRPISFVDIPHWQTDVPDENFVDVFAEDFVGRCDRLASELARPGAERSVPHRVRHDRLSAAHGGGLSRAS